MNGLENVTLGIGKSGYIGYLKGLFKRRLQVKQFLTIFLDIYLPAGIQYIYLNAANVKLEP